MGMSSYVQGIREKSEDWVNKRKAVEALIAAGIEIPNELSNYFGGIDSRYILKDDIAGLEMEIPSRKGTNESEAWIEINVKDIPKGVERVRFVNSY